MVKVKLYPDKVYALLSEIPDPEIPVLTIKDLGILRKVRMEKGEYIITITPTYTACPAMAMISDQIKKILAERGINNVKVELTYTPAWTTDWLSSSAKLKLKKYGIAPPSRTSCNKLSTTELATCPRCNSERTSLISRFGSTACKAFYICEDCRETFDLFKCH
jgi:ring-1,2-phenylacetyl-CoA epoxidase subunit PaaD